jgi:hypothetical protein
MNEEITLTEESANRQLHRLVEKYRTRALWFLKSSLNVDIHNQGADRILKSIAKKSTGEDWIEVRKLLRWRSRNIKETL